MNSELYVGYLRKMEVTIGEGTTFFGRVQWNEVDASRPYLVEIGKNCLVSPGVQVLTHSYDYAVLKVKYGELLTSGRKVVIEDNVFIGTRSIILKGVRIGRNTVIGAGSVVTHDIPPDSVAAGNPCKPIMTIEEYYKKRKRAYIDDAKAYAFETYLRTGKPPDRDRFCSEFPVFANQDKLSAASRPPYNSFNEFLIDAGIPKDKVSPGA